MADPSRELPISHKLTNDNSLLRCAFHDSFQHFQAHLLPVSHITGEVCYSNLTTGQRKATPALPRGKQTQPLRSCSSREEHSERPSCENTAPLCLMSTLSQLTELQIPGFRSNRYGKHREQLPEAAEPR